MLKTKPVVRLMKPQDLDAIVEIDAKETSKSFS